MASPNTPNATNLPRPLGHRVFARAFWILAVFTLLFLLTYPPFESESPYSEPNLVPALIVLVLGAATWISMLIVCIREFRTTTNRPAGLSSVLFFLIYGCELLLAAFALQQR